ncbi:hypothetical protein A3A39_02395 [Candidatus Kaiserbacteria bacterium RIFCSPLOWO2_01_FULL_54_13]|uniref:Uncharacterized protein n=1 Tax=Candidatus Kaiserbacteria bacterium RIFCSPLOWO2_01_FULL_54_13 TaxID=1798512 RepID=A0A1F6F156_9BACT|nr:MAG: hypothetical protein A3A39_02395 [Candidatus Kaiserbacteria bacterium RIFCSPLOWO2_01_FULL_54_13]
MNTLKNIASQVLGLPKGKIQDTLVRRETPEWDSFNHLMLISEIEKKLGIQFTMAEVEKVQTYGELKKTVENKTK